MAYEPPWLLGARRDMELGVLEIRGGDQHHWRILEYHANTTLHATTDEIAWCASSTGTWLIESGFQSTNSARARSYLRWGISLSHPAHGCIVVTKRGGKNQPGPKVIDATGHVGLLVGITAGFVDLLAGNQSNRVCIKSFPVEQVLGYRWPIERLRR